MGQVLVRETQVSQTYVLIGETKKLQSLFIAIRVFDRRGEDGTCTATHIKFNGGQWLDLQNIAYSQHYPVN